MIGTISLTFEGMSVPIRACRKSIGIFFPTCFVFFFVLEVKCGSDYLAETRIRTNLEYVVLHSTSGYIVKKSTYSCSMLRIPAPRTVSAAF